MLPWPLWIVLVLGVSYYIPRMLLPKVPAFEPCNFEMQSITMHNVPIYWQVEEGQCPAGDPNFDAFLPEIEMFFNELEIEKWPKAHCISNAESLFPLAVKFGTDFYDVTELDCKQELELKLKKQVQDFDLKKYIQQNKKANLMNWIV